MMEPMDNTMTADTFVEITVGRIAEPGGALHSARFAITDRRLTYEAIWTAAHQNADSSVPTLDQLGGDEVMHDHVRRLRATEAEVMSRAAADASGADAMTCDVVSCSRCGGDHRAVRFEPMARPFAPAEAAPIVWTRWAPCPTNGQPILQAMKSSALPAEITDDDIEELAAEWQANGQPTLAEVARVAIEDGDATRQERARQRCADILAERRAKAG